MTHTQLVSGAARRDDGPRAMLTDWNLSFRALVDAAPDGLIVCDPRGTIVLANAEAERMFGYGHEELIHKPLEALIPETARRRHAQHFAAYTAAPRARPMGSALDLHGRRKDGSELPVEISLSPVDSERGTLIIAGIRDVSERRQLERENKRTMGYLISAVEAVQDVFLLFDDNDRLLLLNSAARQAAGTAGSKAMVGLTFSEMVRSALAAGLYLLGDEPAESFFQRRKAYHHAPSGVFDLHTSDGRHLRVIEHKTAGRGTVTTISDITVDVHREDELRSARQVAEAASAAKSEFLSSMSHELRTPLNAILGFAQLLERDRKRPLDDRQLERIGHVLRGGEHLLRLIDDILDLSRIETGRIAISTEPVDVAEVLAEVAHTLEPLAQRGQIALVVQPVSRELPRVAADRTRLAQILMNLGSNAIKYGKPTGRVELRTAQTTAMVRITVSDDGIGIPLDKRDKIFEPFQRAGQEAGPIEGTGIGLTISRRLAELMGAGIDFTSEVGRGSEFWIELPIHRTASADERRTSTTSSPTGSPLATGSHLHTVVYVEDNPSNIAFMRDVIDELTSVELITAPTAEIGLPLIRARLPDLVIMDINLPGISGLEALNQLRAWPETRKIPVIALSAAALHRDTARAQYAGFHRYLTKPVKVAELTQALEELLVR